MDINEFLKIESVAKLAGLAPKQELCPDCQEPITAENTLIDNLGNPEKFGHCVACYDPTPYYPKIDQGAGMFIEKKGDAEQAELYALGLIKSKNAFTEVKRLVLVPCKHRTFCRTHGTFWIKLRIRTGINLTRTKSINQTRQKLSAEA